MSVSEERLRTVEALGGECSCCGEKHQEFLTIDHMNQDGYIFRKRLKSKNAGAQQWAQYYREMRDDLATLRVLCYNCHTCITKQNICVHAGDKLL